MLVKEYYYEHFHELTPDKKFHFATRMKNYFKITDFDNYLEKHMPSKNLTPIFRNNDYTKVNHVELRAPLFEKYPKLYGTEAALFRVHHLLVEYNTDIREDFIKLCPIDELYNLSGALLRDDDALKILSTWAINTICLTEELFPRGDDVIGQLSEKTLSLDHQTLNPTLLVYLCTHIIICASGFYTKDVKNSKNINVLKELLEICNNVITNNINTLSLDACVEFLVCCNLVGVRYENTRNRIKNICDEYMQESPYLINYRRDKTPGSYFHTLNGAEHINVLYIMSGLDSE